MSSLFSYTEIIQLSKQFDCHSFIKRNRVYIQPEKLPIKQEKRESGRNLIIIRQKSI